MNRQLEVCSLEHTPFRIMSKDRINFVVGRSDTKEMLCIGNFNKSLADIFQSGDFLLLQINCDGTAEEILAPKTQDVDPSGLIELKSNKAIVCAKVGSYWIVPTGFHEWAEKVFLQIAP